MRHTSISLAIVALLLCGRTVGQSMEPQGEPLAPGIVAPTPDATTPDTVVPPSGALLPSPRGILPVPETNSFTAGSIGGSWNQQPLIEEANPNVIGPGCALCGGGKCCPKSWYVDQQIRIMSHPKPRYFGLSNWRSIGSIPVPPYSAYIYTPALSTALHLSASYEITLGRYLGLDTDNRNHFLEFTFYGTNHWSAGDSVIASAEDRQEVSAGYEGRFGNLFGGRETVAGFNRADLQSAEYRASLNNFEVNLRMVPRSRSDRLVLHKNGKWRRECQRGMFCSWLAGVRLFTMNEDFNFNSHSTIDYYANNILVDTKVATGSYSTKANNGLLGLQVGPEFVFRQCRAEYSMGAKGAAYINFAEQQSWINVSGAVGDEFSDKRDIDNLHRSLSRNGCAASIQLNFNASYKVKPNFILKAGYELLYVAGLALAPEQVNLDLDESIRINNDGSLLFQSARLGFEYLW